MAAATAIHIVGIAGSLRERSYNTGALRAAAELLAEDVTLEWVGIADLPLYNDDLRLQGYPPPVQRLRERLTAADGVLLVTPEYNYSVPGVLKNAIDWASGFQLFSCR
jgi:chromate reductase